MFVRNRSASLGRACILVALLGLPLYANCTKSEDTEPFVPAKEGATQPGGSGTLLDEDSACDRVRAAFEKAYDDLSCNLPDPPQCPDFIRPAAGSGCYEYYEDSVAACEKTYKDATSCGSLAPCVVSAKRNDSLATCVVLMMETGGAGGQSGGEVGGAAPAQGGAPMMEEGGAPAVSGAPAVGGSPDMPTAGAAP